MNVSGLSGTGGGIVRRGKMKPDQACNRFGNVERLLEKVEYDNVRQRNQYSKGNFKVVVLERFSR
jgi:hypothetical protein